MKKLSSLSVWWNDSTSHSRTGFLSGELSTLSTLSTFLIGDLGSTYIYTVSHVMFRVILVPWPLLDPNLVWLEDGRNFKINM